MKTPAMDHPKMHRLARILNIPRYAAWGLMEGLWNFATRYAPAGNVGKYPNQELADALAWDGEPDKLIDAITESGWLDRHETERLIIHDWHEHAPDYLKKREKKREYTFFGKPIKEEQDQNILEKKDRPETQEIFLPENSGKFQNVPEKNGQPSLTQPSLTKPNPTQPSLSEADATETAPGKVNGPETDHERPEADAAGTDLKATAGGQTATGEGENPDRASPGLQGKNERSSAGSPSLEESAWLRKRGMLYQELARILKIDQAATDPAGQEACIRGTQGILLVLEALRKDAEKKGKRFEIYEARLRKLASQSRKSGKSPAALWHWKCLQEWPFLEGM
jgi:hypothetical protein